MAASPHGQFVYKTRGRGRGILGLKEYVPCRRPGCVPEDNMKSSVNNNTDTSGANATEHTVLAMWTFFLLFLHCNVITECPSEMQVFMPVTFRWQNSNGEAQLCC